MRLIAFIILAIPAAWARFTPEEINAEEGAYQGLSGRAHRLLQPIFDQMDEVKAGIRNPFEEQVSEIQKQIDPLQDELRHIYEERGSLDKSLRDNANDEFKILTTDVQMIMELKKSIGSF